MASFRPASRILTRRLLPSPNNNTTTTIKTSSLLIHPMRLLTTTSRPTHFTNSKPSTLIKPKSTNRHKSDDTSKVSPENRPVEVPGPSSSTSNPPIKHSTASAGSPPNDSHLESGIPKSTIYNYKDITSLSESLSNSSSKSQPQPKKILIDVREPSEVLGTGSIPGSKNIPISSASDSFFLSPEEFEDRFGWSKPTQKQEVVFYCKAGVRSKAAARLAGQAGFGGKVGEFPGSWVEWVERGGRIERE